MIEAYREQGLALDAAYVFTAFRCHYEGRVEPSGAVQAAADLLQVCADYGATPDLLYFCDTVGVANPRQIARR